MPSLIKATVGGADSNSYVDLTWATTYFSTRLNIAAWSSAEEADREKALITACRAIEAAGPTCNRRPYGYPPIPPSAYGEPYDPLAPAYPDQALSFPRKKDRDNAGAFAIPEAVKKAQCEEALGLLSFGAEQERRRRLQAAGVTSFSVDGLSESYGLAGATEPLLSAEARQLIGPYLRRGGAIATSDNPDGEWSPGSV